MTSDIEFFDHLELNIDLNAVLQIQGYRGDREPHADIREITTKEIEAARQLIEPSAIYREVEILELEKDAICVEDDLKLHI